MRGRKEPTGKPPEWKLERGTPRSLSYTLRRIRERVGDCPPHKMADKLKIETTTLRKWEDPNRQGLRFSIDFQKLQQYQDALGIPVGIIVLISQIFAAARDKRKDHLLVLEIMTSYLSRMIQEDEVDFRIKEATQGKEASEATYDDWSLLLKKLIDGVFSAVDLHPKADINAYTNNDRLAIHDKRRESRRKKRASNDGANEDSST